MIVLDANRNILLLQRADTGGWGLPGGFMELGETLEETARREVMEEVGLELGELTLMGVFSGADQYFQYPNGDEVFNVTTVYTATARHSRMRLDPDEATTARFVPVEEIPVDLIAPEVPILEQYSRLVKDSQ
ncbi:NUDIX hydrolase [Streptomyces sp. NBC_01435]|uniref:NUDIX hydrolase n=1 Tax=Streptomyces sp. NBC_01435 TaxID=2903865 RepID=UPI002E2F59BF|nr:NUDIX domain-containing protein [Streptomyces sp. NBC_01435]